MREKIIEQKLREKVKENGGLALKFVSPNMAGVPDRIILMSNGKLAFVEVKARGKKLRPLQIKRKDQLEKLGFKVFVLDSVEQIPSLIKEVML